MSARNNNSRKGPYDENFPVASWFIARRHRPIILAFYRFARAADDVADDPHLSATEKFDRLDHLESSLDGRDDDIAEGAVLNSALRANGLTDIHAKQLLSAFRQDVIKHRYADWDQLIDYCTRSAMPVGRFVLDVHNESDLAWARSDALCAALQIINHLQDCAVDFRNLDRVYLPQDIMIAHGASVEDLAAGRATLPLERCLRALASRTEALLRQSEKLEDVLFDYRLATEIAAIRALAYRLVGFLRERDPLSQVVHLRKVNAFTIGSTAGLSFLLRRLWRPRALAKQLRVS